ncbi:FG-GAP-like repeat-containing protein [Nocardioides limicola]|uniref:FG-GAP-like repeat-containing protein n=1 Tax=Nocardioides limicola TaxID=2803368 RepID=UPI00193B8BF9|nr:FG-GAP-like repeat-containing protein [Nocardioides sp. DJM-14]
MPVKKAGFVTACQQILALGVVVVVLAPATNVISLDVVRKAPGEEYSGTATPVSETVVVETEVVDPTLVEHAFEEAEALEAELPAAGALAEAFADVDGRRQATDEHDTSPAEETDDHLAHLLAEAEEELLSDGLLAAVSDEHPVTGYGAVGVTWDVGQEWSEQQILVEVRTRTGEEWSEWEHAEYSPVDAPNVDSDEASGLRDGTEIFFVGEVDAVQARAFTDDGAVPTGLRLVVIDPGHSETQTEVPADAPGDAATETEGGDDALALSSVTKPALRTRKDWGANESWAGTPTYGAVKGGVIHHTVTSNDYSASQVPAMIRSIYSYHTQSRGWKDIGYNFLVDRFGTIWIGRKGGSGRAVIGAHASGYNHVAFGASALGNYDIKEPSSAMMAAFEHLMAWKLAHHGVTANTTWTHNGRSFNTIVGHRDVGSTACPGRYIYAKLPAVRSRAATIQRNGGGVSTPAPPPAPSLPTIVPDPRGNLIGSPYPDLVLRRRSDNRIMLLPTEGLLRYRQSEAFGNFERFESLLVSPDLTGNGRADLVLRNAKGRVLIRPGRPNGRFAKAVRKFKPRAFANVIHLTAVGDLTGNGRNDLVGFNPATKALILFRGRPSGGFKRISLGRNFGNYVTVVGAGDLSGNGRGDILAKDRLGRLWLHAAVGGARLAPRQRIAGSWDRWDAITGLGDHTGNGRPDIFVRDAKTRRGYVLPWNGANFGAPHGPITGVANQVMLSSPGRVGSTGSGPDLVGRRPNGRLSVVKHLGYYDVGDAVDTGISANNIDLLINAGDWTGNGHGDLVIRRADNGRLRVRQGNGRGQFAAPVTISSADHSGQQVHALGDVNGNGRPDLVTRAATGQVHILPGNRLNPVGEPVPAAGMPTLRGANLAPYDAVVWTPDLMLNGRPGLLARERSTGHLYVIRNDGSGNATPRRYLSDGLAGYDLIG